MAQAMNRTHETVKASELAKGHLLSAGTGPTDLILVADAKQMGTGKYAIVAVTTYDRGVPNAEPTLFFQANQDILVVTYALAS